MHIHLLAQVMHIHLAYTSMILLHLMHIHLVAQVMHIHLVYTSMIFSIFPREISVDERGTGLNIFK